ncbi:hypothetical protein [Aliidiomarina indica]|uniref:hypothetical protein n=1 Tax=Aliidiomarina indica TaxID=2749147 RepID=UPI00188E8858|nr:hypothetical protein [Aliidiomarina indica]
MTSVKTLASAIVVAVLMQAPVHAADTTSAHQDMNIHDVLKQELGGQVMHFNQQFTHSVSAAARFQLEADKEEFKNALLDELAENDHLLAKRAEKGEKPLAP